MFMGPLTHAPWLGSCVFDGARAFEDVAPDLDRHCQRLVRSAQSFALRMPVSAGELEEIAREGIAKFPKGTALYIRPMAWAESGHVDIDPETTRWSLSVYEAPLPGQSVFPSPVALSPALLRIRADRRQGRLSLSELRPRHARGARPRLRQRRHARCARPCMRTRHRQHHDGQGRRGSHTGAQRHFPGGHHPQPRFRLLRRIGINVHERSLRWQEFLDADEVFSTGNYGKVLPVTRVEDRDLQPGPSSPAPRALLGLRPWRENLITSPTCFDVMAGRDPAIPLHASPRRPPGSSLGDCKAKLESGFRRNDDEPVWPVVEKNPKCSRFVTIIWMTKQDQNLYPLQPNVKGCRLPL